MTISPQAGSASEVAARLRADALLQQKRIEKATEVNGLRMVTAVRAHMSGRPGPRVQTGDLRRGVRLVLEGSAEGVSRALAVSNSPQARRLELGFVGVDSLGRSYHQPPYPAFIPGRDEVLPRYRADIIAALHLEGRAA